MTRLKGLPFSCSSSSSSSSIARFLYTVPRKDINFCCIVSILSIKPSICILSFSTSSSKLSVFRFNLALVNHNIIISYYTSYLSIRILQHRNNYIVAITRKVPRGSKKPTGL